MKKGIVIGVVIGVALIVFVTHCNVQPESNGENEVALNDSVSNQDGISYFTFLNNLGKVRTVLQLRVTTVKGQELANGNSRSDSQCYHFIASGGDLLNGKSRDNLWLSRAKANEVGYTKINDNALSNGELSVLPNMEMTYPNGEKRSTSYYVTSSGDVFIWPPYLYQNEFYVNETTKVTKNDGTTVKADNSKDVSNMLKGGITLKVGNVDVTM